MLTLPLVLVQAIYLISKTERIFDRDMTHCYRISSLSQPSATENFILLLLQALTAISSGYVERHLRELTGRR